MNEIYEQRINEGINAVYRAMQDRVSAEDLERIKDGFALAYEAHKNQKRKSGEPYILHPIAVARIVAEELMLGPNTVIAAFLHDVVEDTPHTIEEIEERFGEDVAFLVRVVTKQKKEHYEMSVQLDNFKQILDSVHYDIRALLIKLSDRLHNMRTLDSMLPHKQMKIAGETDYFYAPLANRLGLYNIKTELENLSMRYRCPHDYNHMIKLLKEDEERNRPTLDGFTQRIKDHLTSHGIAVRVEVSYRMPYSLWRKMKKVHKDFHHLDHRHFVSIIFPDGLADTEKNTCLKIYSLLTDIFKEKPGGISNYVDSPKENGYQSFHVNLLSERGTWEEVHISSERMVRNSCLGCVAARTEDNIKKWIAKFKSVLQDISHNSQEGGFIESVVTSFYNDDIMVFTPQGKPVILPKRATALDLAFEIHSELGAHAKYARINGALCSVKTELKRGDCVEIGTDNKITPKADWLDHVLTYKAKRFVRSYIAKSRRGETIQHRCPLCHPLPGDEVIGFKQDDENQIMIHKRDCPTAIRLSSQRGEYILSVDLPPHPNILYPIAIRIKAVDRYHLLSEMTECITNKLQLPIDSIETHTVDYIVDCLIRFQVHSFDELQDIIANISSIDGVDEVQREDTYNK